MTLRQPLHPLYLVGALLLVLCVAGFLGGAGSHSRPPHILTTTLELPADCLLVLYITRDQTGIYVAYVNADGDDVLMQYFGDDYQYRHRYVFKRK